MDKDINDIKIKKTAILIIISVTIFTVARSFIGLYWSDETYVMSEIFDFAKGQKMFSDTHSSIQLFTKALSPIAVLFIKLTGSTDGIVLFFRILYCAIQFLVALFVYSVIIKYNRVITALSCFTVIMLFAPLAFNNFSYHNVVGLCMWLICVILLIFYKDENSIIPQRVFLIGIVTSIMTTTYLPMVFLGLCVLAIILVLCVKRRIKVILIIAIFIASWISIPIILLFIALNEQGSLDELTRVLSEYISSKALIARDTNFLKAVIMLAVQLYPKWFLILILIGSAIIIILRLCSFKKLLFPALTAFIVIYIIGCTVFNKYTVIGMNYIGHAFLYLFILLLIITWKRENSKRNLVFIVAFFIPVITASFIAYITSGTLMIASSAFMMPIFIPIIIMIGESYEESSFKTNKILQVIIVLVFTLALLFFRTTSDYMNHFNPGTNIISTLNTQLCDGPCRGLFVSAGRAEIYYSVMNDLREDILPDDGIATLNCLPWVFLLTDAESKMKYNWSMILENGDSSLSLKFYTQNPTRKPNVVIVIKESADLIPLDWKNDDSFMQFMSDYEETAVREYYTIYREKNQKRLE